MQSSITSSNQKEYPKDYVVPVIADAGSNGKCRYWLGLSI